MSFKKGHEKVGGRKKGVQNVATKELRERVTLLIDDLYDLVVTDLKTLTPSERLRSLTQLMEFALPKLQRSEQKVNLDFDNMSDSEIDRVFDRLIKRSNTHENEN